MMPLVNRRVFTFGLLATGVECKIGDQRRTAAFLMCGICLSGSQGGGRIGELQNSRHHVEAS